MVLWYVICACDTLITYFWNVLNRNVQKLFWTSGLRFIYFFGSIFLRKFVLNFNTKTNTLLIKFWPEKRVSSISNIPVFTSILLTKTSFLVSGSSNSMSSTKKSLYYEVGHSSGNFGLLYSAGLVFDGT